MSNTAITKADLASAVSELKRSVLTVMIAVAVVQFALLSGLLLKIGH